MQLQLPRRILQADRKSRAAQERPYGNSLNYAGHLQLMTSDILLLAERDHTIADLLQAVPDWDEYSAGWFQESCLRNASVLGALQSPPLQADPLDEGDFCYTKLFASTRDETFTRFIANEILSKLTKE